MLLFLNRTLTIKINRPARFRLPLHFALNQRKRIIDERLRHIGAAGIHPFRWKEFFPVADLINIDRAAFQMVWTVFSIKEIMRPVSPQTAAFTPSRPARTDSSISVAEAIMPEQR